MHDLSEFRDQLERSLSMRHPHGQTSSFSRDDMRSRSLGPGARGHLHGGTQLGAGTRVMGGGTRIGGIQTRVMGGGTFLGVVGESFLL